MSTHKPKQRCSRHTLSALLAVILTTLLALTPAVALADGSKPSSAKLEALQEKIKTLNERISSEISRKQTMVSELAKLEQRIGALHRKLDALHDQKSTLQARRKKLDQAVQTSRVEAQSAEKALSRSLRSSFILGRQPRIKLALQGEDPARVARQLAYYGYYARANARHIGALAASIAHYQTLQTKLADTQKRLSQTLASQQKSLADLKASQSKRKAVLQKLQQDIAGNQSRVSRLKRDAQRLEEVIRSVHQDIDSVAFDDVPRVAFSKLRGELPWPIAGKIIDSFGSSRADDGALKWEAVRIAAPAGTRVRAIGYGRIAYAGWLPFYGLVLMVDHGDGYLVVYGHNEAIYKQVGQWVQPGDVIATVGSSGGQPQPMLYFQIRHGNKPLNPVRWCRSTHPRAR